MEEQVTAFVLLGTATQATMHLDYNMTPKLRFDAAVNPCRPPAQYR